MHSCHKYLKFNVKGNDNARIKLIVENKHNNTLLLKNADLLGPEARFRSLLSNE